MTQEADTTLAYFETSIGKKLAMAISGLVVLGFVVAHMLGNLQIYLGPERLNAYAELLTGLGSLLWVFRGVILLAAVVHVVSAYQVARQSWAARPVRYARKRYVATSYAARTMRVGGPIIALFVIYHLLHLTGGQLHPDAASYDAADVYANVVRGFGVWWVAAIYIAAMGLVGLHLYHGVWSMFQSVGLGRPTWVRWRRALAVLIALAVSAGNISIPVAVLTGAVGAP
jgi:succinate dehydrogenase / fumarate reductase cytochrome b subunit